MDFLKSSRLDQLGIALSGVCAVHCLITPALLFLLPVVGASFASPWVHRLFAFALMPLGLVAFGRGYLRSGRLLAMLLGLVGMSVLIASLVVQDQHCCATQMSHGHIAANVAASLLLVIGHGLNLRSISRKCDRCPESIP